MAKVPRQKRSFPRGLNETGNKTQTPKNVADLPQADQPVDPFESVDAPDLDFRGEDVEARDWSGESGSGKG